MKHGCYQTINNTVCYYERAFNITVILGKLSDYNYMLKEQVDTRKDVQSAQSKMISKEHVLKPIPRAKANEHLENELDDNKVIIESKDKKEDNWIMPEHMSIDYFYKNIYNSALKKKDDRNSNKYEALEDNDDE